MSETFVLQGDELRSVYKNGSGICPSLELLKWLEDSGVGHRWSKNYSYLEREWRWTITFKQPSGAILFKLRWR